MLRIGIKQRGARVQGRGARGRKNDFFQVPMLSVGTHLQYVSVSSYFMRTLSSSFILFFLLFFSATVFAQNIEPPQIVDVRVGIADRCKVGLWTPVEITLLGGSESLTGVVTVTVPDGDGIPSQVSTPPQKPCQVLPGRQTKVLLYVRFGRVTGSMDIQFIVNNRVAANKTLETSFQKDKDHFPDPLEGQSLIISIGQKTVDLDNLPGIREIPAEHRPVVAQLNDVAQLPTHWYGYEGVNAIIISTSDAEMYRKLRPESAQVAALDQWIRLGGRLVFCVGTQADEVLAKSSALNLFAPGKFEQMITLRNAGAFEIYCGSTVAVPQSSGGEKSTIRSPKLTDVQGVIEARDSDVPLIIRTPRGLGQIMFLAADLDQEPLAKWGDRSLFLAKLLDMPAIHTEAQSQNVSMSYYGYTDLSGQLRSSLDRFTGVQVIPFYIVALMIVFYILLIGPGDYLFLRKIAGRMYLTWFTFPIIVLIVSVASWAMVYYLKGNQLRINQTDLVDIDTTSGLVRGTTWFNIFSPRMQTFDLSLQAKQADGKADPKAESWIAWYGLPGSALGGMNPRGANPSLWPESYAFTSNLDAIQGVPIQVWSTKSFTGQWHSSTTLFPQADLTYEDQSLSGSITNTLDFPLDNCILAFDRWVYELGTVSPGQTVTIDQNLKRPELKTLLTGKKAIFGEKFSQEITPYDESATADTAYILRLMMFYNAVDGKSYTKLDNGYQSFVDMSDLLKTGQAILVGTASSTSADKSHGVALINDGNNMSDSMDKHSMMYRFVLPLKNPTASAEKASK